MPNKDFFLSRLAQSIEDQTYTDYEIVWSMKGKMAENTNFAIKKAKGDIIKVLFMDDYFAHKDSLQKIADAFTGGWLVSGCLHDDGKGITDAHYPWYNEDIRKGKNTIGSPSVLAFENKEPLLFDEEMSWLLDCDLYHRLYERHGQPTILNDLNVIIGIGEHQTSNLMSNEDKQLEHKYIEEKYETN